MGFTAPYTWAAGTIRWIRAYRQQLSHTVEPAPHAVPLFFLPDGIMEHPRLRAAHALPALLRSSPASRVPDGLFPIHHINAPRAPFSGQKKKGFRTHPEPTVLIIILIKQPI